MLGGPHAWCSWRRPARDELHKPVASSRATAVGWSSGQATTTRRDDATSSARARPVIREVSGAFQRAFYRRWPTKGVLVYDACLAQSDELARVIDSGNIRADLVAVAKLTSSSFRTKRRNEL